MSTFQSISSTEVQVAFLISNYHSQGNHTVLVDIATRCVAEIVSHRSRISAWSTAVGKLWIPCRRRATPADADTVEELFDGECKV